MLTPSLFLCHSTSKRTLLKAAAIESNHFTTFSSILFIFFRLWLLVFCFRVLCYATHIGHLHIAYNKNEVGKRSFKCTEIAPNTLTIFFVCNRKWGCVSVCVFVYLSRSTWQFACVWGGGGETKKCIYLYPNLMDAIKLGAAVIDCSTNKKRRMRTELNKIKTMLMVMATASKTKIIIIKLYERIRNWKWNDENTKIRNLIQQHLQWCKCKKDTLWPLAAVGGSWAGG